MDALAVVLSVLYQFGTNSAFLLLCGLGLIVILSDAAGFRERRISGQWIVNWTGAWAQTATGRPRLSAGANRH